MNKDTVSKQYLRESFVDKTMRGRWRHLKELTVDNIDLAREEIKNFPLRYKPYNYADKLITCTGIKGFPLTDEEQDIIKSMNELPHNEKFYIEDEFVVRLSLLLEGNTDIQECHFSCIKQEVAYNIALPFASNLPMRKGRAPKGYPDLYIMMPGTTKGIFFELKTKGGVVYKEQFEWRRRLLDEGYEHHFVCTLNGVKEAILSFL